MHHSSLYQHKVLSIWYNHYRMGMDMSILHAGSCNPHRLRAHFIFKYLACMSLTAQEESLHGRYLFSFVLEVFCQFGFSETETGTWHPHPLLFSPLLTKGSTEATDTEKCKCKCVSPWGMWSVIIYISLPFLTRQFHLCSFPIKINLAAFHCAELPLQVDVELRDRRLDTLTGGQIYRRTDMQLVPRYILLTDEVFITCILRGPTTWNRTTLNIQISRVRMIPN
jgi:hypothetical protein